MMARSLDWCRRAHDDLMDAALAFALLVWVPLLERAGERLYQRGLARSKRIRRG